MISDQSEEAELQPEFTLRQETGSWLSTAGQHFLKKKKKKKNREPRRGFGFSLFFFLLFPLQLIGWAETLSLDSAHHLPQRSCFQLQSLMREKSDWIVSHCGWQMFHPITLFPPHWSLPPPSSSSFSSSKRVRGNKWICETFTKFSQSFKTLRPSQFAAVSLTAAAAAPFVYRGEVEVEKKEWRLLLHH